MCQTLSWSWNRIRNVETFVQQRWLMKNAAKTRGSTVLVTKTSRWLKVERLWKASIPNGSCFDIYNIALRNSFIRSLINELFRRFLEKETLKGVCLFFPQIFLRGSLVCTSHVSTVLMTCKSFNDGQSWRKTRTLNLVPLENSEIKKYFQNFFI